MDIERTVTLTNLELDSDTGVKFDSIRESTCTISDDSVDVNLDELGNLTELENHYDQGEKFAEGGQGEIKTGTDKLLKRYVAIKSLKKDFIKQDSVVKTFISEAIVTAQLDHPAIIPLYSVNNDSEGGLHLSMKLILGKTLKELLEHDKAHSNDKGAETKALIQRLEVFTSVCDAVNYAHDKNIIHRDLKPDNIMIGDHHEVYVMDWGIAKVLSEDSTDTDTSISGTPGYISPEVLEKQGCSPASDQYSLGIILYEIITLTTAVRGETVNARLINSYNGILPEFDHINDKIRIHPDLIAICKKACRKDPAHRYENVDGLSEDIRLFISKQEVSARPDNGLRKIYRFIAAHRHLAAIAVLVFLLGSSSMTILSLKAQNEMVTESKIREIKLLDLRSAIEQKSHRIDRHFNFLSNLLSRYDDRISHLLDVKKPHSTETLKHFKLFKDTQSVQGTVNSKYYKQPVNPGHINYKLAGDLKADKVKDKLLHLGSLADYSLAIISESGEDNSLGLEKAKDILVNDGFPVSWLYFGLKEGIIINYPANGALNENYDPRERPWYKRAKEAGKLIWTEPYEDLFGLGTVISAAKPIYSKDQEFLGIAALDLTLDYTKKIMNSGKENSALIANYLIDENGKVIISGTDSKFHKKINIDEFLMHLKSNETGHYETIIDGRKIMIDSASISTLSWFYIEVIDIEKYLQSN